MAGGAGGMGGEATQMTPVLTPRARGMVMPTFVESTVAVPAADTCDSVQLTGSRDGWSLAVTSSYDTTGCAVADTYNSRSQVLSVPKPTSTPGPKVPAHRQWPAQRAGKGQRGGKKRPRRRRFLRLAPARRSLVSFDARDVESDEGYFLAGRSLTGVFIAGSLLLTNLSTEQLVGLNGAVFKDGHLVGVAWEALARASSASASSAPRSDAVSSPARRKSSRALFLSPLCAYTDARLYKDSAVSRCRPLSRTRMSSACPYTHTFTYTHILFYI